MASLLAQRPVRLSSTEPLVPKGKAAPNHGRPHVASVRLDDSSRYKRRKRQDEMRLVAAMPLPPPADRAGPLLLTAGAIYSPAVWPSGGSSARRRISHDLYKLPNSHGSFLVKAHRFSAALPVTSIFSHSFLPYF